MQSEQTAPLTVAAIVFATREAVWINRNAASAFNALVAAEIRVKTLVASRSVLYGAII